MKLENVLFWGAPNFCLGVSWISIPYFWDLANKSQSSFMANLYFIPLSLIVIGCLFGLVIDYVLVKDLVKKCIKFFRV